MSNETTQNNAMDLARRIMASYAGVSALEMNLAAMGVIAIIAEEVGNGDLAIRTGRALIETGEAVNAKQKN